MDIIYDKFFVLCVVSCLILVSFCYFYQEDEDSKETITGIVTKNNTSEKGFVFDLETSQGSTIHCFCKESPLVNNIYSIEGSYSDDNSMFFVSKMYCYRSE